MFRRIVHTHTHDKNVLKCKLCGKLKMILNQLCNTRSNVEYTITTDHVVHSCNVLKLSLTTSDCFVCLSSDSDWIDGYVTYRQAPTELRRKDRDPQYKQKEQDV